MIGRVRKVPGLEVYRILGRILHADGLYVEDGEWVGLEQITTANTHDYTIPQYVKSQRVGAARFDND